MKLEIDYGGVRWMFFSHVAEELNPDLPTGARGRKVSVYWADLRDAMQSPRLDGPVQAIADMTGNDFSSTRVFLLRRVRDLALRRLTGISRRSMMQGLVGIDPLLAAWFLASELQCFCDEVLGDRELTEKLRSLPRFELDAVRVAKSYAARMIRTFSMTPDAAKREATALRQHMGGYSPTQSARETYMLFEDEFHGDRRSSASRSRSGDRLSTWTANIIVSISDAWDFDSRLVDQVQTWEVTASDPSREMMMNNIIRTDGERIADELAKDLNDGRKGKPQGVYGLEERSTRCAIEALEAYPPSAPAEGRGSGRASLGAAAVLPLVSGVAVGATAVFLGGRHR